MNLKFSKWKKILFTVLAVFATGTLFIYVFTIRAPRSFPSDSIITVKPGSGLLQLSSSLEQDGVISSAFWFRIAAIILGGERGMQAGDYYLSAKENVFDVARRIVRGDRQIETVKITIPEGFTVKKISSLFDERFPYFDHTSFEQLAPEGYLFPETYFIQVNATATSTIRILRDHFIREIFPLMPEVEKSGKSLEEIITMASIIESEAKTKEDREIVSGILWKRIELGIPLQVDASFVYVNGKTTKDLTLDDLKINSPYNTYLYKGLPPGPISNPGIESIEAALNPTKTPYLYFLTGNDGVMYYATTFNEHIKNKQKYLNTP